MTRKFILATIFCVFSLNVAKSQIDYYINNQDFDWSRWIAIDSLQHKIAFLTDSIKNLDSLTVILNIKTYNIMDVDGEDGLDAVVRTPGKTSFYVNKNDNLELEYETTERIISLGRSKPWSPVNFQTLVPVDGKANALKTYIPITEGEKLNYSLESTLLIHPQLTLINENIPPVGFEILRVPELHWAPNSVSSNVIKLYDQGTKGFAVASSSDETNRVWWLVLISEGKQTYRVGWMLRKNLKQLPRR